MIFETPRLIVREIISQDLENLHGIYGDPEIMQFIRIPLTLAGTNELIVQQLQEYAFTPGLGRFVVIDKTTGKFAGILLLRQSVLAGGMEIGYAFLKIFWGLGLATEVLMGGLTYGFEKFGCNEIFAITHPENRKSQSVLYKTGFVFIREKMEKEGKIQVFGISRYMNFSKPPGFQMELISVDKMERLRNIAIDSYIDHYQHLWIDHGAWYLNFSFSKEKLEKELSDPGNLFFILLSGRNPIGFLKLRMGFNFEGIEYEDAIELERIYFRSIHTGQGLGHKVLEVVKKIALQKQKRAIFLKVMDSSVGPIKFYKKAGFEIYGNLYLGFEKMKPEFRGMYIMKLQLMA